MSPRTKGTDWKGEQEFLRCSCAQVVPWLDAMAGRARSESPLDFEDFASRPTGSARSGALFNVQMSRKKAEQDSILLANRIRLLRNEEAKTRKKIVETEKKTQEILETRRRNEKRRQEKEAFEAHKEALESEFRAKQMVDRADQQHKLQDKMRIIRERNQGAGHVIRQERQAYQQVVDFERQAAADEAFARAEQVRAAMSQAARSRARSEGAKQELARGALRERLLREEDERRQRLADIDRMEREEKELMERLQRSQERHRAAYMQLEDVLRQSGSETSVGLSPMGSVAPLEASSRRRPERDVTCASPARMSPDLHAEIIFGSTRDSTSSRGSRRPEVAASRSLPSGPAPARPPLPRAPPGARPSSASRQAVRMNAAGAAGDAVDKLRQKHSTSAMSNASTASGGAETAANGPCEGSGQSTPSSSAHQIRYTTVDGLQLDIPAEEDLDLAALLNGR
eukprot:s8_g10.t1